MFDNIGLTSETQLRRHSQVPAYGMRREVNVFTLSSLRAAPRVWRRLALAPVAAVVLLGCDPAVRDDSNLKFGDPGKQGECTRALPRAGRAFVLSEDEVFPCLLVVESKAVTLESKGVGPSPAPVVVVDKSGRFFSSVSSGGGVAVWAPDGTFDRIVGRVGQGPGEFAAGWLNLFVDEWNNLYARDNSSNWLVFDSALVYRRSLRVGSVGFPSITHLMEDGRLLSSYAPGNPPATYFEVVDISDRESSLRIPLGPIPKEQVRGKKRASRATTYVGDGVFWAAPMEGSSSGYQLEKWTTKGEILRVLTRPVSWFPEPARVTQAVRSEGERPPPHIELIHSNGSGLLFVLVRVNDARWHAVANPREMQLQYDELYDWHYEIIDSDAGAVLSSGMADKRENMPYGLFPGGFDGYTVENSGARSNTIRIVTLRIRGR